MKAKRNIYIPLVQLHQMCEGGEMSFICQKLWTCEHINSINQSIVCYVKSVSMKMYVRWLSIIFCRCIHFSIKMWYLSRGILPYDVLEVLHFSHTRWKAINWKLSYSILILTPPSTPLHPPSPTPPHPPRLWERGNLESLDTKFKRLVWYIINSYNIFVGYQTY